MLVPNHFLLLFKITNDLLKTLLKQLYFLLIACYLLRLHHCPLSVLLLSTSIDIYLSLEPHVHLLHSCDELFLFVDLLPLQDGLDR